MNRIFALVAVAALGGVVASTGIAYEQSNGDGNACPGSRAITPGTSARLCALDYWQARLDRALENCIVRNTAGDYRSAAECRIDETRGAA